MEIASTLFMRSVFIRQFYHEKENIYILLTVGKSVFKDSKLTK